MPRRSFSVQHRGPLQLYMFSQLLCVFFVEGESRHRERERERQQLRENLKKRECETAKSRSLVSPRLFRVSLVSSLTACLLVEKAGGAAAAVGGREMAISPFRGAQ